MRGLDRLYIGFKAQGANAYSDVFLAAGIP